MKLTLDNFWMKVFCADDRGLLHKVLAVGSDKDVFDLEGGLKTLVTVSTGVVAVVESSFVGKAPACKLNKTPLFVSSDDMLFEVLMVSSDGKQINDCMEANENASLIATVENQGLHIVSLNEPSNAKKG